MDSVERLEVTNGRTEFSLKWERTSVRVPKRVYFLMAPLSDDEIFINGTEASDSIIIKNLSPRKANDD